MIRFAWIKGASFSQYEFSLLCDAVGLANKAVNTEDFRRFLKELNEPKISTAFGPTNVIQMSVSKYSPWNPFTSAVARTDNGVIYLNRKRFRIEPYLPKKLGNAQFTDEDISHARQLLAAAIAGTLCHEYCHVLGFEHTSNREAYLERDTPYKVGDMVEMIAKNLVA